MGIKTSYKEHGVIYRDEASMLAIACKRHMALWRVWVARLEPGNPSPTPTHMDTIDIAQADQRESFAAAATEKAADDDDEPMSKAAVLALLDHAAGHLEADWPAWEKRDKSGDGEEGDGGEVEGGTKGRTSQATEILALVADTWEVFITPEQVPYTSFIGKGGHLETHKLASKATRQRLAYLYYAKHKKAPNSEALAAAIGTLSGKALHEGA